VSQRGVFTVHPQPEVPYTDGILVQYVIPSYLKAEFRQKLDACGIHHAGIYADLDGLAKRLVSINMRDTSVPWQTTPPVAGKVNPLDPNKGQFGKEAEKNGWRVSAEVYTLEEGKWFFIDIKVKSTDPEKPFLKEASFYLHDSFPEPVVRVRAHKGRARLKTSAYGAFMVGVIIEDDGTQLELDLAELPDAPQVFRDQ
jgi:hypothetical protein